MQNRLGDKKRRILLICCLVGEEEQGNINIPGPKGTSKSLLYFNLSVTVNQKCEIEGSGDHTSQNLLSKRRWKLNLSIRFYLADLADISYFHRPYCSSYSAYVCYCVQVQKYGEICGLMEDNVCTLSRYSCWIWR